MVAIAEPSRCHRRARTCKRAGSPSCEAERKLKTRFHRNQQYSITALTDGSGAIVERYAYTAYGQPTFLDGSGTVLASSAEDNRYTYTGREWDEVLGLYHYRARMYDAAEGRFVSRDPLKYIDGQNLYRGYFGNKLTDPSGTRTAVGVDDNCSIYGPCLIYRWDPGDGGASPPHTNRCYYESRYGRVWFPCPIDDRRIDPDVPVETYNCAGLALRTYNYDLYHPELVKQKMPKPTPCNNNCKCGQIKCRLWEFDVWLVDSQTGEKVVKHRDFHIVCSHLAHAHAAFPNITEWGEPRCYEKMGPGAITGPVFPHEAAPQPGNISPDSIPKGHHIKFENVRQTCYCLGKPEIVR